MKATQRIAGPVCEATLGVLWANSVEYFWHRFAMHSPRPNYIQRRHADHHWRTVAEAEDKRTRLALTPPVLAMWAVHAAVLGWLGRWVALGAMTGYLVTLDLVHAWQHRVPMSWLEEKHTGPLAAVRRSHLLHHVPELDHTRMSIFLPLWDSLLRTR